ncbi:hypothetical protein BC628DRAFT_1393558 [Trametes gibbosa]|nr:hypothetical protein BC628DRAFT_1393558 [Trametes gibbosa]
MRAIVDAFVGSASLTASRTRRTGSCRRWLGEPLGSAASTAWFSLVLGLRLAFACRFGELRFFNRGPSQ